MAHQFQVYQDASKGFRWRLLADNNQVIATASETYNAKADCLQSIDIIKKGNASLGMYQDKTGEWRWRAIHTNGKTIATSGESYKAKDGAESGIVRVRELAPKAPVVDMKV